MRTSVLGALALAALITIGAGCAPETAPETPSAEVNEMPSSDAAGTQLEDTPADNDTPDAAINVDVAPAPTPSPAPTPAPTPSPAPTPAPAAATAKTFVVTANNFMYDVKEIRVKKGDKVRIVFKNAEGFHDWVLDEFAGAKTSKHPAGGEETIEFTADKAGTFEYYCSVGSHRAMGMKGSLIVE